MIEKQGFILKNQVWLIMPIALCTWRALLQSSGRRGSGDLTLIPVLWRWRLRVVGSGSTQKERGDVPLIGMDRAARAGNGQIIVFVRKDLLQSAGDVTENTGQGHNVGLMLGQRLRRWPSNKPTLAQHPWLLLACNHRHQRKYWSPLCRENQPAVTSHFSSTQLPFFWP